MTSLPEPMTPPDCDLRGYDFMPVFGHRLFGSAFYARATDAEFRAALRLWWAAWQQCPAGSLPKDDAALALLADYGRDVKGFAKVRAAALHGFVECDDGRLYHPLLCAEARGAYERRRKERERKAAFRARDKASETVTPGGDMTPTSASCPAGQDEGRDAESVGTGQNRTEQNLKKEDNPPTPRKRRRVSPLKGFDEFWKLYPLKKAMGAAEKAWPKAVAACGGDPDLIIMGLKVATSLDRFDMREEGRWCPHASTWLNAKRWLDGMEPEPDAQSPLMTH